MIKNNHQLVLKNVFVTKISITFEFLVKNPKKNCHVFLGAFIWNHPITSVAITKVTITTVTITRVTITTITLTITIAITNSHKILVTKKILSQKSFSHKKI